MRYLFLLLFSTLSLGAFAQFSITGLTAQSNQVSDIYCDSLITMTFSNLTASSAGGTAEISQVIEGTNFTAYQLAVSVDWGDGTTTTHFGGTSTSGTIMSLTPQVSYHYSAIGNYAITTTVYNPQNQTSATNVTYVTIGGCSIQLYSFVGLDCDGDGINEQTITTPIPAIVSNIWMGAAQNTTLNNTSVNTLTGLPSGPLLVTIDPLWLAQNGYTVNANSYNQFISSGYGAYTISITLNCGTPPTSGYLCTNGYLFCDGNGNNVYDSGESVLSNAPITITNLDNGNNYITVTTNSNGYYSSDLQGLPGDSLVVSVNPNYMTNMGYTALYPNIDVVGVDCQSGGAQILNNIPIQCGNNNPFPYLCYSGYIFCDANGNGIQNVGEAPLMGAPITLGWTTFNSASVTVYSDSSGYFEYCGSIYGVTSMAMATVSSAWLTNNGSALPNNNNVFGIMGSWTSITQPLSIPVYCAGNATSCSDFWATITPWSGYYQGNTAILRLNWGNYGPGGTPYTLTMNWPAGVTLQTSSVQNPNYVINGNSITWTFNSAPTSFTNTDYLYFTVPSGILNGVQHMFTSTITSSNGTDCYEGNNSGGLLQIVGNSYDPNDKTVFKKSFYETYGTAFQESTIDWSMDDELEYTIRFQNTGTAPAQNIYIIDTLDAELDWSTFQLLHSTHGIDVVNLGNGIFRFEFNNIWLPDSSVSQELSQGHLTFRIRENMGNALFSEITNTAYIYFDWNPAIITNTTYNFNDWLEFVGEENAFNVEAYPNPMLNELTLKVEGPFNYEIHDLTGRKLIQGMGVGQTTISTEALASGTYLISVYVNGSKQTGKVLKY